MTKIFSIAVLVALVGWPIVSSSEFNQRRHLAPSEQVKVTAAIARAYAQGGIKDQSNIVHGRKSGYANPVGGVTSTINIGNVTNSTRAPQQQTIVTRDVTNICLNCR